MNKYIADDLERSSDDYNAQITRFTFSLHSFYNFIFLYIKTTIIFTFQKYNKAVEENLKVL